MLAKNQSRWVFRRKAELVRCVASGQISQTEACQKYAISDEEFATWSQEVSNRRKSKTCVCSAPSEVCAGCADLFPVQSKLARTALNWTLPQAASISGVSIRSLTRFESGDFLSKELMDKLLASYEAHGLRFIKTKTEVGLILVKSC